MDDKNPPAFPFDWKDYQPTTGEQVVREQFSGMSLRDYFAAKVLNGLISSGANWSGTGDAEIIAFYSYKIADAMLSKRQKGHPAK